MLDGHVFDVPMYFVFSLSLDRIVRCLDKSLIIIENICE